MTRAPSWLVACGVALSLMGCDKNDTQIGVDQPFRVRDAQFHRGALPGDEPPDGGMIMSVADAGENTPATITALDTNNLVVIQGQGAKKFSGRASANTVAIAMALDGVGSGYWILPVGAPDPVTGELTWDVLTDFAPDVETGTYYVRAVALDENDEAGEQVERKLCIAGRIPDNLHACNEAAAPPRAVIALTWDSNADLDLQVVAPSGTIIEAKHPMGGAEARSGAGGLIDRDSNGSCVIDGIRAESLVWDKVMPRGLYGIYVNMFDACKQPAVRFHVAVYTATKKKDGTESLRAFYEADGDLLDIGANGGSARGLFVSEFKFE